MRVRYLSTDALTEAALSALSALLEPAERTRADRFAFPRDRRDYIAAHALLRRELSTASSVAPAAWRFAADSHGKPIVVDPEIPRPPAFSLTHTHGLVACVVSEDMNDEVDVGVDVEWVTRELNVDELAPRVLAASEIAHLSRLPDDRRRVAFLELWTLKESYAKALGLGLSVGLSSIAFAVSVRADEPTPLLGREPALAAAVRSPRGRWSFALTEPVQGARLAVAIRSADATAWSIDIRPADPI